MMDTENPTTAWFSTTVLPLRVLHRASARHARYMEASESSAIRARKTRTHAHGGTHGFKIAPRESLDHGAAQHTADHADQMPHPSTAHSHGPRGHSVSCVALQRGPHVPSRFSRPFFRIPSESSHSQSLHGCSYCEHSRTTRRAPHQAALTASLSILRLT